MDIFIWGASRLQVASQGVGGDAGGSLRREKVVMPPWVPDVVLRSRAPNVAVRSRESPNTQMFPAPKNSARLSSSIPFEMVTHQWTFMLPEHDLAGKCHRTLILMLLRVRCFPPTSEFATCCSRLSDLWTSVMVLLPRSMSLCGLRLLFLLLLLKSMAKSAA
jgi:hypothetical protein